MDSDRRDEDVPGSHGARAGRDAYSAGRDLTINYWGLEGPGRGRLDDQGFAGPVAAPAGTAELIAEKTRSFVGRDYVFKAVSDFVTNESCGYFTIEGDPGAGKTTILAEYARRTGCIAHFNIGSQSLNTSGYFIRSISSHMAARYSIAAAAQAATSERYGEILDRLLLEARSSHAAAEPLVLVVDALDEVNTVGEPANANVLFLPLRLPPKVYFLLSSRRAEVALQSESPVLVYDLASYHANTMDDIREYLDRVGRQERFSAWMADHSIPLSTFIAVLAEKSEGNFMYLRHILPELTGGRYQDLDLRRLPRGLEQYYEAHWRVMEMSRGLSSRRSRSGSSTSCASSRGRSRRRCLPGSCMR